MPGILTRTESALRKQEISSPVRSPPAPTPAGFPYRRRHDVVIIETHDVESLFRRAGSWDLGPRIFTRPSALASYYLLRLWGVQK